MTKVTCKKCGYIAYLDVNSPDGTDTWELNDAIKYLIDKQRSHKCK